MESSGVFLRNLTVRDIQCKNSRIGKLLYVTTQTPIEECLQLIVNNDILSVPVKDEQTDSFVGFVDISHIASFMAFSSLSETNTQPTLETMLKFTNLKQPAIDVMYETSLCTLEASASLKDALEWLAQGTARILVTQEDTEPNILSQTDLIRFLHANIENFGDLKDKTLNSANSSQVKFTNKKMHVAKVESTALAAFQIMHVNGVEALPILDNNGALVATFSGTDLRGFTQEKLPSLFLPVLEFLAQQGSRKNFVSCKNTDTIHHVINLMANDHIRYVWVLDEKEKLVGSVFMSDIANYFYVHTLGVWYSGDN